MKRILLFDGDIIAYQMTFKCQQSVNTHDEVWEYKCDLAEVREHITDYIEYWVSYLKADGYRIALSHQENFRKTVFPQYKDNRKTQMKPVGLVPTKEMLIKEYEAVHEPNLEADDLLSLWATCMDDEGIIFSIDKDFKSVPCRLFNPNNEELGVQYISPEEADFNFYCQALAGDTTDGYTGAPGIGLKGAEKILDAADNYWQAIVDTYKSKGLKEKDAIRNARCARILRYGEYDFATGEIKLWEPPNLKGDV